MSLWLQLLLTLFSHGFIRETTATLEYVYQSRPGLPFWRDGEDEGPVWTKTENTGWCAHSSHMLMTLDKAELIHCKQRCELNAQCRNFVVDESGKCWFSFGFDTCEKIGWTLHTRRLSWSNPKLCVTDRQRRDDNCNEILLGHFTFPFLSPYRRMYVNPRGAVHFIGASRGIPCCEPLHDCVFETDDCLLNGTDYRNLIAPLLSDFMVNNGTEEAKQTKAVTTEIRTKQYNTSLDIHFKSLYYADGTGPVDFILTLFEHGGIMFAFKDWRTPPGHYISGVIPLIAPDIKPANVDQYQRSDGSFILPSDLGANTTIVMCPLPTAKLCIPHTKVPLASPFSLVLGNLACLIEFEIAPVCVFRPQNLTDPSQQIISLGSIHPDSSLILCETPSADRMEGWSNTDEYPVFVSLSIIKPNNKYQSITAESVSILIVPTDRVSLLFFRTKLTAKEGYQAACPKCPQLSICQQDCAGLWLGEAAIDDCGDCTGGTAPLFYNENMNCQATCNGKKVKEGLCLCGHIDPRTKKEVKEPCLNSDYTPKTMIETLGSIRFYRQALFGILVAAALATIGALVVSRLSTGHARVLNVRVFNRGNHLLARVPSSSSSLAEEGDRRPSTPSHSIDAGGPSSSSQSVPVFSPSTTPRSRSTGNNGDGITPLIHAANSL